MIELHGEMSIGFNERDDKATLNQAETDDHI